MAEVVQVAFYPDKPHGNFLAALKEAKSKIDTGLLMKPVKAVPGTPARIIAVGETPHWICEHVWISDPEDTECLKEALEWGLGLKYDVEVFTVLRIMRKILGNGVEEIA